MTTLNTGPTRGARPSAENDIYTALLCVAFLFLLVATIYVAYRAQTLFGGLLPPRRPRSQGKLLTAARRGAVLGCVAVRIKDDRRQRCFSAV